MWHKYLNRNYDQLRMFRFANLKFNQDDLGMTKQRPISKSKDFIFRLARTEGFIRGASFFGILGAVSALLYVKSKYYDPVYTAPKLLEAKQREAQADKKARDSLYYNNLGAPTKPNRTIDELFIFLVSTEAINKAIEFITYGLDLNNDQQKGLDSYTSENDERMLELLAESKKRKGGH